ncbi:hypothetical protein CAPTEDRAFT_202570 [Capitella teleta]|uniref:CUB domain-containing protein n=1 Tax=Capitella teleta TaxID=283909 RepID=R7V3T9_CAPTE|nr:hypothetical protein CAPTEDRAFT_202570 [Capitella teleta]|eukprot:ELU13132.1 hypothetical protein CAPTEDRAFT_202570 [Capitella teleta]
MDILIMLCQHHSWVSTLIPTPLRNLKCNRNVSRNSKVIWTCVLLGAVALFSYLVVEKVQKLQSHPKAVNVEVTYNESLIFPAVTICNSNKYRLTQLQEKGLYDLFVDIFPARYAKKANTSEASIGECEERYSLHKGICGIPDLEAYSRTPISTVRGSWAWVIKETTRAVCQNLCSDIYSSACSSVLYITSARECVLSSYSGSLPGLPCNDTAYDDFEFFRRRRCAAQLKLLCNYDSNTDCPLKDDQTANDTWTVVLSQEASKPNVDNTLNSSSGSYTHLLETANRPNYTARMYADYYNTTGLCMGFAYAFMGYDQTRIRLFGIQEDKVENTISTIEYTTTYRNSEVLWHYYKAELPEGINMIMIEGKREPCISTRLGLGYLGNEDKTKSGKTCLRWDSFTSYDKYWSPNNIPDRTWSDAENYCRSIAFKQDIPSCATSLDIFRDSLEIEPCAIPYCPCSQSQFRCDNAFCVSKSLTCNGVDDCGDSSDEAIVCASISKVTCEFKDDFMCGYKVQGVESLKWLRVQGDSNSDDHENGLDSMTNFAFTPIGPDYMMILLSNQGLSGDGSLLSSKIINVRAEQNICFDAYFNPHDNDNSASLTVDLNYLGIKRIVLYSVPKASYWRQFCVRAPPGEYQIVFSGSMGQQFSENIAIGDVRVSSSATVGIVKAPFAVEFDCNFSMNDCDYSSESETSLVKWKRFSVQYFDTFTKFIDLIGSAPCYIWLEEEGTITSPNYPSPYPIGHEAKYVLTGVPGSTIQLNFEYFSTGSGKDFLTIFAENGGVLDEMEKLDGWSNNGSYFYNTQLLILTFVSDQAAIKSSVSTRGFNITFKITNPTALTDYGLFGGLGASSLKDVRTTTLISPIVTLNGIHCVEAILYSVTELSIEKREYKQSIETLKSALAFTAHISDKTALSQTLAVAVKEVKTSPASSVTDISCKFDDVTQCDYLDVSESQVAWTRAESKGLCEIYTANDYVMNTVFTSSERRTARITTPKVNFTSGCLIVDTMMLSNDSEQIGDLSLYAVHDSVPRLFLRVELTSDATWKEIEASLVAGSYRILFVFFPKVIPNRQSLLGLFSLADVRVSTFGCANPTAHYAIPNQPIYSTLTSYESTILTTELPSITTLSSSSSLRERENLGPELNLYDQLTALEKNVSMAEVSEGLAHKLDDMLYSCKWNGLADNCDDFEPQPTDAGYCYTYNGQEHNVIRTKRTGADLGLQLVLNIEEYQYVDFLDQIDSGFKVHLHAQYEIPSVSSSGFGVSPGTHALASVTYTKIHSLQPPWGKCSSIPLINTDRYTRLRCGLECLTNATIDECQCQESYMKGNGVNCTVDQTLNCVHRESTPVFEAREACELKCPDACDVVTQPVSLSYTGLSGDNLLNSMSSSQLKALTDSYHDATTMADRIKAGKMVTTINEILSVNREYKKSSDFFASKIRNTHTSIISRVVKAMISYADTNQEEIRNKFFGDLSKYSQTYHKEVRVFVKDMTDSLQSAIALLSSFGSRLTLYCKNSLTTKGTKLDDVPKLFIFTLAEPFYKYASYEYFFRTLEESPYLISLEDMTDPAIEFLNGEYTLNDIIDTFNYNGTWVEIWSEICPYTNVKYRNVKVSMSTLFTKMATLSDTITNYEDFLNELSEWKQKLLPLSVTTNLEEFGDTFQQSYLSTTEHLGQLLRDYAENKNSKRHLAESIIDMNLDELNENNTLILNEFKTVIAALKAEAKTFSSTLRTQYKKGVDYLKQLSNFFPRESEKFLKLAQSASLWLQPYPVIETQKIIVYKRERSELWRVWPETSNLEDFVTTIAPHVITDITESYFNELIAMLNQVEIDTEQHFKQLTASIDTLQTFCSQYLQDTQIDGAFISKNFLRLDIYFGELKYESVEQKRDYDIGTLFSEIGGYMGLLIGGSAITIVEFLDLIIYNCFLKGHGKMRSVIKVKPMSS